MDAARPGLFEEIYRAKRVTVEAAAALVPARGTISVPFFLGIPNALIAELARKARAGAYEDLRLYYMHSNAQMHEHLFNAETARVIRPRPFYMGPGERAFVKASTEKLLEYMPGDFSQVPRIMADVIGIDTLLLRVSPMLPSGHFSIGLTGAYTPYVMRRCRQVIVEVNRQMPRVLGDTLLHVSDVAAIVENDHPLEEFQYPTNVRSAPRSPRISFR